MLDINQLLNMFAVLYQGFLDFGSVFLLTLREAVQRLNELFPSFASVLLGFISNNTEWEIWDYSLIVLILGFSGVAFITISLVKWLLDLIN